MKPSRPNFEHPPLVEQAISLVFEPISDWQVVDYGLFWNEIASEFPDVASDAPFETTIEEFSGARPRQVGLQVHRTPPLPRAMFRNPKNGELVQVQRDRFGFNWAKVEDQPYPRSEPLMKRFRTLLGQFGAYVERRSLGDLALQQCELTNLNILPVAEFGSSYADLSNALRIDPIDFEIPFLQAEAVQRSRQLRILNDSGEAIGRLHLAVLPVVSNVDGSEAYKFELTARSAPNIDCLETALEFFDVARNAINSAFIGSVTDEMKKRWGETDAK